MDKNLKITEAVLMKSDSMILNGVNGYIVIQDMLAAYAYFDLINHTNVLCRLFKLCLPIFETPDITVLKRTKKRLTTVGLQHLPYYINRANEANSSNPFLTYAENKDIDFNYNGNFSNVTDMGDVWDDEQIENDEDDLIDVIGSHNIAIVAGTDEEIDEARRRLFSTRSSKSSVAGVGTDTENQLNRALFASRLRGVDCDGEDNESNGENEADEQFSVHIGRQLGKKKKR